MITRNAIRDFKAWIATCKELGWSEKTMPALADLWWKWHGDDGQLLASPRVTHNG